MVDFVMNESDTDASDSDNELQSAFAKGLLKPGLNEVIEAPRKQFVNNLAEIKTGIKTLKLKLPWIETLDLINAPAPMAPDIALQMQETAQRRINLQKNNAKLPQTGLENDPVMDEFKRETLIHRQAQAAVVDGITRLKNIGISTKRPDDYFAEMAKSDEHMQKVRRNLLAKQAGQARAEKIRQLRQQKKLGKQIQVQAKLKQQADKRQLLEQVKRIRKGKSNNMDFSDDPKPKSGKNSKNMHNGKKLKDSAKRKMKDSKFGFGGKKKGGKSNTSDSSAMVDRRGSGGKFAGNKGSKKGFRPGKDKRQKMKSKGRK